MALARRAKSSFSKPRSNFSSAGSAAPDAPGESAQSTLSRAKHRTFRMKHFHGRSKDKRLVGGLLYPLRVAPGCPENSMRASATNDASVPALVGGARR